MLVAVVPESPDGFGFALPVRHDLTLCLVHSNYPAARADGGRERRIEMRLARVRRMSVGDIVAADHMLQECLIEVDADGAIHLDVGGDGLITFLCESLTIEELEARGSRDISPKK
jgi:hypothetical protein